MTVLILDAVIIARPRFLPPPERGRVGGGGLTRDRACDVTPTRRCPTAIATPALLGEGLRHHSRGDALGAFGLDHAARHLPPGEARRRPFGNLGKHRQRLRPREEERRPRGLRQGKEAVRRSFERSDEARFKCGVAPLVARSSQPWRAEPWSVSRSPPCPRTTHERRCRVRPALSPSSRSPCRCRRGRHDPSRHLRSSPWRTGRQYRAPCFACCTS